MSAMNNHPSEEPPFPAVPRGVLITCYSLLACVFVYVLVSRYFLPFYLAEPIEPAVIQGTANSMAQPFTPADMRVDPNTASWMELCRLPGIGETKAKSIVEYREKHRSANGEPVFRSADDLTHVLGIGDKTVEQIRAGLKFETSPLEESPAPANPPN